MREREGRGVAVGGEINRMVKTQHKHKLKVTYLMDWGRVV